MENLRALVPSWKPLLAVWLLLLLLPVPLTAADPIQPGIWRLDGITPGLPSSDLEPLRKKIGKATVVAMGESIHGSSGYLVAKHRIFRDLVERAGFRAIAIETPWSAADGLAAYVKSCAGSPEEALQNLDGLWQGAEVLELVQWMCGWNRTHKKAKDRLSLIGFDIQQPEADGPALTAFLARIGVAGDDSPAAGVRRCNGVSGPRAPRGQVGADGHAACMESLDAIAQRFAADSKAIIKKTSKTDFEWAKVRLVSLRSWQEFSFYDGSDFRRADEERDWGMAYVLRAMQSLRLPKNTKLVAWAHNFHVSKAPMENHGLANTMGTFLSAMLGSKYFVVGLIGWQISYDQPGGFCGTGRLPAPTSLEAKLHGLGEDHLLSDPKVGSPVFDPGTAMPVSGFLVVPQDHYDAFVFLEESPRMTPVGRPPC